MNICANCFNDEEIKRFIEGFQIDVQIDGTCDCCGKQSKVVDLDELKDFFNGVLSLYIKDNSGIDLISLIQEKWNIFSSKECARKILSLIINPEKCGFSLNDNVAYCEEIQQNIKKWDDLKTEIKESKRYFYDEESLDLEPLNVIDINEGEHLYRARIIPKGKDILSKEEMGCPPKDKATAGRANPLGIPYLYLCSDEETTLYEVRSLYLDRISVGKFKVSRDIRIVDFNYKINIYKSVCDNSRCDLINDIKRNFLSEKISEDLSKPLHRYDSEIEYIPTQMICEYCKIRGAHGVRFNSSLRKEGSNIVLFNSSDAECIGVKTYEINEVKIRKDEINV